MKTFHTSVFINAPKNRVWEIMFADKTYRQWTKPFNPTSYAKGDWSEGSEIWFLGTGDNGEVGGMYSRIKANSPNEFMSIQHLGIVMPDGSIDTTSDEVKKWTPAFENYTLVEKDGGTDLQIDVDLNEEHQEMFAGMWPKALNILKELCEAK